MGKLTGCWQRMGGAPVWDGEKEWSMVLHMRGEDYNDHAFMIMARQTEKEVMYVFGPGGGAGKQIDQLCARMGERNLATFISRIPEDFTVYIFGHSEGSGWAMCMDDLMQKNQQTIRRVLLTSGPRMISQKMLADLNASPRPFMFLASGILEAGAPMYDLFTFGGNIPRDYTSPPVTAFTCSKNQKANLDNCVVPEAVNLADEMEQRYYPRRVGEVHLFQFYRECLRICLKTTFQGMQLVPNTIPYIIVER